ncbi:methanogenic corrinoid protein MtbC1 [Saccharothrix tamanrassetensis]|uniref:Methanogenic corrinoid protein MtbC1 n=1 Tax=Saccharothrix tamanrassetensis TaxID=1051531 RepID=A0A841CRD6_9PSEU|nr:cobalamin-dependent protein [Saccharothrix tamanrassetensis]MBB5958056.1 methanogenic corrinoid protein MtbC1 [Saccharothrix tamanrassetensis]
MTTTTRETLDARTCAQRLWEAVVVGDEHAARDVVLTASGEGLDTESVLLDVIGAVQRRVGAEWAANRLTVAQEHAATAINERVIATLAGTATFPEPHRGRITVACVDGEWHALPARLLSEVLRLRGFRVDYLGAQVPAPHLITHLHSTGPDAVALSGSIATRLPTAHATITACQAAGVPVLAGGGAFGPDGRYARLLGADFWAPDARSAADRLTEAPLPRPRGTHQPIDDLPHLGDQEYTMVSRTSGQLVKAAYSALEARFPELASYSESQRHHTAQDLAHIVDFLAASLYIDDDALFLGFLAWTTDILGARGVPARFLPPALDVLAAELRDFPRAKRVLARAHELSTRTLGVEGPDHDHGPAA